MVILRDRDVHNVAPYHSGRHYTGATVLLWPKHGDEWATLGLAMGGQAPEAPGAAPGPHVARQERLTAAI